MNFKTNDHFVNLMIKDENGKFSMIKSNWVVNIIPRENELIQVTIDDSCYEVYRVVGVVHLIDSAFNKKQAVALIIEHANCEVPDLEDLKEGKEDE